MISLCEFDVYCVSVGSVSRLKEEFGAFGRSEARGMMNASEVEAKRFVQGQDTPGERTFGVRTLLVMPLGAFTSIKGLPTCAFLPLV